MFPKSLIIPLMAVSFTFVNPCDPPKEQEIQPTENDVIHDVTVIYPEFKSVPRAYSVEGVFAPSEVTTITANANGTIEELFVREGDSVQINDPVVSLSNTETLDMIDLKRALLKEYQARLNEVQAKLEASRGEDRPLPIRETEFLDEEPLGAPVTKPFGSASEQETKPQTFKELAEVLESAMDRLQKEADYLDRLLLNLTQNSPVSGVVTKIHVSAGNKVKEQDKLVEISQTNPLSVTFMVPDSVASFVDKNSTVKVEPLDAQEFKGEGTVYFISPNVDTASGRIEIKATVSNDEGRMKGGQKAQVHLATRKMDRVIVLPKRVLHFEDNKTYVFTVFHNQAKLVSVEPGEETPDGQVQIFGDLRVDDPIVIDRPVELKHDSYVRVKNHP